jgi:hypothetical protein
MLRRRKREIREPDLPQAPQTLHRCRIDERDLGIVEFNEMMDGVEDPFQGNEMLPNTGRGACRRERGA